jgi:hypothetical protein
MNAKFTRERLEERGAEYLNRLTCEWDNSNLQALLSHYNKCKDNEAKLNKAVNILSKLTESSWIELSLISDMKKVARG